MINLRRLLETRIYMMDQNIMSWVLLYCKAKEEQRALENLKNQGIEAFYPSRKVEKVIKGIRSIKSEALFPNYLFVKLDPSVANFNAIRSTRGVANFVKFGLSHAKVANNLVNKMQEYDDTQQPIVSDDSIIKTGEKVIVTQGIYQGLEAIYHNNVGLERSILLIKLLEQEAKLEIDNKDFKAK